MATPSPTTPPPSDAAELRRLVGYSLVSALGQLLPVPLVDDWMRNFLRRHHAAELALGYGLVLEPAAVRVLALGPNAGCLGAGKGCLLTSLLYPVLYVAKRLLIKLSHKILYFLSIKDCIDAFAADFEEGYLLRHALAAGALGPPGSTPAPSRVLAVRRAVEETAAEDDRSPIWRTANSVLRGSGRALTHAARVTLRPLSRLRRRPDPKVEEEVYEDVERRGEAELGGVIDELAAELGQETGYLDRMTRRLDARLASIPE